MLIIYYSYFADNTQNFDNIPHNPPSQSTGSEGEGNLQSKMIYKEDEQIYPRTGLYSTLSRNFGTKLRDKLADPDIEFSEIRSNHKFDSALHNSDLGSSFEDDRCAAGSTRTTSPQKGGSPRFEGRPLHSSQVHRCNSFGIRGASPDGRAGIRGGSMRRPTFGMSSDGASSPISKYALRKASNNHFDAWKFTDSEGFKKFSDPSLAELPIGKSPRQYDFLNECVPKRNFSAFPGSSTPHLDPARYDLYQD